VLPPASALRVPLSKSSAMTMPSPDYTKKTGVLSIPPGTTTGVINIPIIDDNLKENGEDFFVKLGTPSPAGAAIDKGTGQIEFSVLMKGFEFAKALQQEHFNENYVESDKYPKATFKGKLADVSKVKFSTDGSYTVPVSGQLTIHGETKDISTNATITVKGGAVSGHTEFTISLDDYKISIPALVKDKIAKSVKIVVNCNYENMK